MKKLTKSKVRTPHEHLEEITNFFFDRMRECSLTSTLLSIENIPQAFDLLSKHDSITEVERGILSECLISALSDATEGLLFEYLLQQKYYKSDEDICQDGEVCGQVIQNEGGLVVDLRIKSEFRVYVHMTGRLFQDEAYLSSYFEDLIEQFDISRKEKVFIQVIMLRDELNSDIESLEIQREQLESTDQLDDVSKERFDSQLFLLSKIYDRILGIVNTYHGSFTLPFPAIDGDHSLKNRQVPGNNETLGETTTSEFLNGIGLSH